MRKKNEFEIIFIIEINAFRMYELIKLPISYSFCQTSIV